MSKENNYKNLYISDGSVKEHFQDEYNKKLIRKINNICKHLKLSGMLLKDACVLENIKYHRFKTLMDQDNILKSLIDYKKAEYKKDLFEKFTESAKQGNRQDLRWLIKNRFSEEFDGSSSEGMGDSNLRDAIDFVRRNGDLSPMVTKDNAQPVDEEDMLESDNEIDPKKELEKILQINYDPAKRE